VGTNFWVLMPLPRDGALNWDCPGPEVFFWEVCPRQSMGFLPSGGQCTSKAPRKSVFGQGAAAQPASCPAICGIEKGDGRIKRLSRWAPR
jgi:hypothetical protein